MSIGENLKRLRERAEMTQDALGKLAEVKQSDISKWEKKGQVPTIKPLMRLAIALDTSVDALLHGVDTRYDEISRKRLSDSGNKSYELTSPVPGSEVQGGTGTGDQPNHADARDNLSEPPPSLDAQELSRLVHRYELVRELDTAAATIRRVTDALRSMGGAPGTQRTPSRRTGSDPSLRRKASRGGRA